MNHFSFDKVDTYAVRIRMKTPEGKRGSSISEIQIFANKVAAEEEPVDHSRQWRCIARCQPA